MRSVKLVCLAYGYKKCLWIKINILRFIGTAFYYEDAIEVLIHGHWNIYLNADLFGIF